MKYLIEIEVPMETYCDHQFNFNTNLIDELNRLLWEDITFYNSKLLSVREVRTIEKE